MNQNKQISAGKYDRSWADLHGLPVRTITPRHIGMLNKQNLFVRLAKSVHLFLTTRYSWSTSWDVAAR